MIILINLKKNRRFITSIFEKQSKLIEVLLDILKCEISFKKKKSKKIAKILCNMFLDEYKEIFFNSEYTLEEIFIHSNEKFSEVNNEGLDVYPKSLYTDILENLISTEYSYEKLFHDHNRAMESILNNHTLAKDGKNEKLIQNLAKKKSTYSPTDVPIGKLLVCILI
jgi:hypothetical protein